jgi:hypothetical protein
MLGAALLLRAFVPGLLLSLSSQQEVLFGRAIDFEIIMEGRRLFLDVPMTLEYYFCESYCEKKVKVTN